MSDLTQYPALVFALSFLVGFTGKETDDVSVTKARGAAAADETTSNG
jgi:hypothetical protein